MGPIRWVVGLAGRVWHRVFGIGVVGLTVQAFCAQCSLRVRALVVQLIRSLALRVMCSVRVKEIVQIQLMAVKKCCMDRCARRFACIGR